MTRRTNGSGTHAPSSLLQLCRAMQVVDVPRDGESNYLSAGHVEVPISGETAKTGNKKWSAPPLEEAHSERKQETSPNSERHFSVNLAGSLNSCVIQINRQRYRVLVDTGAEVSLIHRRVFDKFKDSYNLEKQKVNLQAVSGGKLQVDGCVTITFKRVGQKFSQSFYVVEGLNRNIILERDWIIENQVVLYFNELRSMKVGQVYVPLEKDLHISALVRASNTVVIKPHTAAICRAKTHGIVDSEVKQLCQVFPTDRGYLSTEPGLQLQGSVVSLRRDKTFPVLISNHRNKTFQVKQGSVIGKMEKLNEENAVTSMEETKEEMGKTKAEGNWLTDLSEAMLEY